MGNSLGCVGLGERLSAAAKDGDAAEAQRLLAANPGLARCTTFGNLNSPLHVAAAKGHHEFLTVCSANQLFAQIAALLLENGADVNARNIYGQVWRVENLSGRTALHMAAAGGHVKCVRLLVADAAGDRDGYVNKAANGGVTALHLAALHGHVECVHLLIDEHASLAAQTLPCVAAPMASIGAGSTPLHYAACGGEVKCCQILVSRGADRTAINCNGWLPIDAARIWGCNWLEHVLSPKSHLPIPKFPPSGYLSQPLPSLITIAREQGLNLSSEVSDGFDEGADACAVCLERPCIVAAEGCGHELCVKCAMDLCSVIKSYDSAGIAGEIPCPLCRSGIASFRTTAAPAPASSGTSPGGLGESGRRRNNSGGSEHEASSGGQKGYGSIDPDAGAVVPLYYAPFAPSAILT
uniref:RING-type E3 ubiquitin transferase n=1 Tax=Oryza punctata TaxID=4537 RepID=A0A0E0L797_ORYPU